MDITLCPLQNENFRDDVQQHRLNKAGLKWYMFVDEIIVRFTGRNNHLHNLATFKYLIQPKLKVSPNNENKVWN